MRRLLTAAAVTGALLASAYAAQAQFFSRTKPAEPMPAEAKTAAAPPEAARPGPALPEVKQTPCTNPGALGVSRTVEIDTTAGPAFGLEQYKAYDFLEPKEVVLTFDDGPWPTTPDVLKALEHHCTKALFFPIGKHALYHPDILKQVAAAGHTVGSHTWSHANLKKLKPEQAKEEIEKGFSAVKMGLGGAPAPFFRFPFLQDPQDSVTYLGTRNVGIFSMDLDSFDFKFRKHDQIIKTVMDKLEKKGKGIVLMHDFQKGTAQAIGDLLDQMKAKGYKVVQIKAKAPLTTMVEYDDVVAKDFKGPLNLSRPVSSVVKTVPTSQ